MRDVTDVKIDKTSQQSFLIWAGLFCLLAWIVWGSASASATGPLGTEMRLGAIQLSEATTTAAILGVSQEPGEPGEIVVVETAWSTNAVHAGNTNVLAIVLNIVEPYHVNPSQAHLHDDFLIPTAVKIKSATDVLSDAFSVGAIQYPLPELVTVGPPDEPRQVDALAGQVVVYVPISAAQSQPAGQYELTVEVTYQACDRTQCLAPVTLSRPVILNVADPFETIPNTNSPLPDAPNTAKPDLFAGYDAHRVDPGVGQVARQQDVKFDVFGLGFGVNAGAGLGYLLLLAVAALGGMLLNFTPCVLPVIPLKILSLSQVAGQAGRRVVLGISMSVGVLAFWLGLGGLIAGFSGFTATNQLFQYPVFTIGVGVVIAVMAVGMCGLFNIQLPQFVYRINPRHDSVAGSFGFGVMTAILSTPCTAPFMGSAAAWAAGQHPATTLTTFTAIGAGMALPYLLLSAWPTLIDRMPRTGPASVLIKQVMGLLLLAAAAYFIGVGLSGWWVSPPDSPSVAYWWPVMGLVAAAGMWMGYGTVRATSSMVKRAVFVGLGVVLTAGSVYGAVRLTDKGPIDWVNYTPQRFEDALRDEEVVVMDFTAEWCLNCKWLERNVLHDPAVVKVLDQDSVVAMKVDLTGNNEPGNSKLKDVGRLTIPLLVIFTPDGRESFKSDFYTTQQVIDAVKNAGASH